MKKLFIILFLALLLISPFKAKAEEVNPLVSEYRATILQLIDLLTKQVIFLQNKLNELKAAESNLTSSTTTMYMPEINPDILENSIESLEPLVIPKSPTNPVVAENPKNPVCNFSVTQLKDLPPNGTPNFKIEGNIYSDLFYGINVGIGDGNTEFRYLPFGKLRATTQVFNNAFHGDVTKFKSVLGKEVCYADLTQE